MLSKHGLSTTAIKVGFNFDIVLRSVFSYKNISLKFYCKLRTNLEDS